MVKFLVLHQRISCRYSLKLPIRDDFNNYLRGTDSGLFNRGSPFDKMTVVTYSKRQARAISVDRD